MERQALIHPERPVRRAAVATLVSLGVHAALFGALAAWMVAALAAQRRAEAERPKEVTLARLDPAQWERNRSVAEPRTPERRAERPTAPLEKDSLDSLMAKALSRPHGDAGTSDKAAGAKLPVEAMAKEPPEGGGVAPTLPGTTDVPLGPLLDLRPRPAPSRPLVMNFAPVGGADLPKDGTTFMNLTVAHPEAWRFANFFERAVEHMDSVWRYEMGAPIPNELAELIMSRRERGRCSMTAVQIDRSGRVIDARVRKSSGIPELDAILVETIRRTAPYVNLPDAMLDAGGHYTDTWGLCIGVRG